MPQRVKISVRDTRCFQQSPVLILHCPWLHRHIFPSQEIVFCRWDGTGPAFAEGRPCPPAAGSTPGAVTFGRQHHQTGAVPTADALYGFADMDYPIPQVNILILQGAQLPKTQAGVQCQQNADTGCRRFVHDHLCQPLDLVRIEDVDLLSSIRWQLHSHPGLGQSSFLALYLRMDFNNTPTSLALFPERPFFCNRRRNSEIWFRPSVG